MLRLFQRMFRMIAEEKPSLRVYSEPVPPNLLINDAVVESLERLFELSDSLLVHAESLSAHPKTKEHRAFSWQIGISFKRLDEIEDFSAFRSAIEKASTIQDWALADKMENRIWYDTHMKLLGSVGRIIDVLNRADDRDPLYAALTKRGRDGTFQYQPRILNEALALFRHHAAVSSLLEQRLSALPALPRLQFSPKF